MTTNVKDAKVLRVFSASLDCPLCDASQDGWLIDPRGKEHECDECHGHYFVPNDIRLDF